MIETERLKIKPLTYIQLLKYINIDHSLELELGIDKTVRTLSTELKEAIETNILVKVADLSKNYLFSTLWTLISKEKNQMVGDLCFVGEPNAKGEIEIGYGVYDQFRGNGYMKEAVGGMVLWAKQHDQVKAIVADTEKNNLASSTILEKNNFRRVGETETLYHWRLDLRKK